MKQKEFFGYGSIDNLTEILSGLNSKNIFLVRGKSSYETSGAEKILSVLLKNYAVSYFDEFSVNPALEDIIKGMDSFIETGCDTIIAVGGGSVIDIAKSVNILSGQEVNPELILKGEAKITNKGKPLIAIPTTSGSGSEATHFAVSYAGKKKYSLAHEFVLPDYAVIDPQFTYNLPSHITAVSGMDAFSQAIESYWNVNATEESKNYSAEAITLILENLKTAVNLPADESRIKMSRGAHIAGKAINITKTTAPHAISYSMTSYFHVPHGQAVSITLGELLEYNYNVTEKDLQGNKSIVEIKKNIHELCKLTGCKDIKECKHMINELMKSIGLKTKLSELDISTDKDLKVIMDNVNLERMKNNPRRISDESLEKILRNIL